MRHLETVRLRDIAVNEAKPRQAGLATCYIYQKAEQISGKLPATLADALVVIDLHRREGSVFKRKGWLYEK